MRTSRWRMPALCALLLAASCAATAAAQPRIATTETVPVTVPNSEQRIIRSTATGREYLVMVAWPDQPPPENGYRVLYVLDANAQFLTAVDTVRSYLRRTDVGPEIPTLVVGIGYPPGKNIQAERTLDLTPVTQEPRAKAQTGGADDFIDFIERDLKPWIARDYPVDPDRQSLMGHSLAGMFTLRTLTLRPEAFESFIGISSSFWFGGHVLSQEIEAFARNRKPGDAPVRVLLVVGEYEEALRPGAWSKDPAGASKSQADLQRRGQVTRAREAVRHLAAAPGVLVDFAEIPGEDHGSVIPAGMGRGVGFMLFGPTAVPAVPDARAYFDMTAEERYQLRLQVRALPDPHRIPWLNQLKRTLHEGLSQEEMKVLHDERQEMDQRHGSKPHLVNADPSEKP